MGSQSLNTVDEDDADARHLLGPLLDDLGDGGRLQIVEGSEGGLRREATLTV